MEQKKIVILSELLKRFQNQIEFNDVLFIAKGDFTELQNECALHGLETEKVGNVLELKIRKFFSFDVVYFPQAVARLVDTTEKVLLILDKNGDFSFNNKDNVLEHNTNCTPEFKVFCRNAYAYYRLYNFLKSADFANHHNSANNEIVIYSPSKGILKITYDNIPKIDSSIDRTDVTKKLIDTATQPQMKSFFQNALFIFSQERGSIGLDEIIDKALDIINVTKRDFDLVSKQFDFDKFKDSLFKEKEKYFSNIREIIGKIFSQAIGVPISISAAVFSAYKVSDDKFMLWIVLVAFAIYTAFYIKIQFIYLSDLSEIKSDFQNDFEIIKEKSGLDKEVIKAEKKKIEGKLSKSITIVRWLIAIVLILAILVCAYMLYQITMINKESSSMINYLFKCLVFLLVHKQTIV